MHTYACDTHRHPCTHAHTCTHAHARYGFCCRFYDELMSIILAPSDETVPGLALSFKFCFSSSLLLSSLFFSLRERMEEMG